MIRKANAKVNLGLNIVRKREDGYHDIETVFYPIDVCDIVEVVPSKGDSSTLTSYGRTIDCPVEKNLAMKAYRLMEEVYKLPPVDIYLHKNIPDGAGLGGGSSDAATVMLLLRDVFNIDASDSDLAKLASKLGADCAFFIYNKPMLAAGIGDVLSPLKVSLQGYYMLLIKPDVSVPTAVAYSKVKPHESSYDIAKLVSGNIEEWPGKLYNDFEPSVFAEYPYLSKLKDKMAMQEGNLYASMSGSGSSIFGIFENVILAEKAKSQFEEDNIYVINL